MNIFQIKSINGNRTICNALSDLVAFVQFKKREKYPWRSVNFTKINTPPWVFLTFFTLYKCYQIAERTIYRKVTESLFYDNTTIMATMLSL